MLKILTSSQVKALDAFTIAHEPVSSIDLMERASERFVNKFLEIFPQKNKTIYIFCGLGNNGGDGLAIARLLLAKSYQVKVFVVKYAEKSSPDFQINYNRLEKTAKINILEKEADFPRISPEAVVIDAIFGIGLSRPLEGLSAGVVKFLNSLPCSRVAVDISSGLFADRVNADKDIIFRAGYTLSFELPKLAFLLPQNEISVGSFFILPIGLRQDFVQKAEASYFYIQSDFAQSLYKPRAKFSHKGTFGHGLLMVGSYGKVGAAVLSARASLRSGIGLLTVHTPQCAYSILQNSIPEAMVSPDTGKNYLEMLPSLDNKKYKAIGIGAGIDTRARTRSFVEKLLEQSKLPMVFDADALNILSQQQDLLKKLPKNSVLTPHPKEFERLAGKSKDHFERLELLRDFSQEYQVYIVLKGANTAIATPQGHVYFNSTGNAGMATAGSGDVLLGVITALLAQGYSAFEASTFGVYLHGKAGDLAVQSLSQEALIASDLIDYLGKAFLTFV